MTNDADSANERHDEADADRSAAPEQTETGFDEGARVGPRDEKVGQFDEGVAEEHDADERHGRFDTGAAEKEDDEQGRYDEGERQDP